MLIVNIHEAKTHLSRLLDQVVKGEPFIIAKAGKPLVKVVPLETPEAGRVRRLGFMTGQIAVPDDFDRMGTAEIEQLFGGVSWNCCWIRNCCCGCRAAGAFTGRGPHGDRRRSQPADVQRGELWEVAIKSGLR